MSQTARGSLRPQQQQAEMVAERSERPLSGRGGEGAGGGRGREGAGRVTSAERERGEGGEGLARGLGVGTFGMLASSNRAGAGARGTAAGTDSWSLFEAMASGKGARLNGGYAAPPPSILQVMSLAEHMCMARRCFAPLRGIVFGRAASASSEPIWPCCPGPRQYQSSQLSAHVKSHRVGREFGQFLTVFLPVGPSGTCC